MPRNQKIASMLQVSLDDSDKCTLVSIVPFMISEFKPGIYPGRFVIPPCLNAKDPEILTIGTSVYFIPQFNGDEELPAHVIKTAPKDIAKSVINDYMSGQMDVNTDCCPGFVWLPGELTKEEFLNKFALLHLEMKKKQNKWFGKLVERADNDWNRYKRHTVISDNQRFAARALGLNKDWLTTEHHEIPVKCPACFTNCAPQAIVCANCRCILDKDKHSKLSFAA